VIEYISNRPSIHVRNLCMKGAGWRTIFPLNEENCHFFFSSRYAMAAGISALDIGVDDVVLVPSYNCGTEIDPMLHLGIKPVFYEVGKNLLPNLADLLKKITGRVRGIMITHFLGFPQPVEEIKEICAERNLFLIEDCAHAFLSMFKGRFLGSYGDIAFYSLLKTLPVPNGGVLLINNVNIRHQHNPKRVSLFPTIYSVGELLKYRTWSVNYSAKEKMLRRMGDSLFLSLTAARLFLIGIRKILKINGLFLVRPDSYQFREDLQSWGISGLAKRIIGGVNFGEIKERRRTNFEYYLKYFLEHIRGTLPFKELPSGVCPLLFPLIVESAKKREKIYGILKSKGIITHPWWNKFHSIVPWHDFPEAVYLKDRLLGLPIHQDLTLKHLERVIEEFENAYKTD